ncbi:RimK family alpha-L-glutamate ligase [Promineifilum sp.]|uniref:ATP-grasp domain-containing protein n=1 Tax=Promineifilum sp. TaxID=2664178 RepID=UPI0035AFF528
MRVAILTCRKLPNFVTWEIPNVDELFADDRRLIAEFARQGDEAISVVWSDTSVDWNQFDLALIRSTWDYIDERERFLSVLAEIDRSSCRLFNPLEAVRWNSVKSYLFDLHEWLIPIVPSLSASAADAPALQDAAIQRGWQQAVLKPMIGAGAADVTLVAAQDIAATLGQLAAKQPHQAFLLQPLVESVLDEGEWSFIFIDGEFSHALLKKPAPDDYRAHGIYGGTVKAIEPRRDDLLQAKAILASLPFDLLYARLDLVRVAGRLAVMELELIEPILYFDLAPDGAGRLVRAARSRSRPNRFYH